MTRLIFASLSGENPSRSGAAVGNPAAAARQAIRTMINMDFFMTEDSITRSSIGAASSLQTNFRGDATGRLRRYFRAYSLAAHGAAPQLQIDNFPISVGRGHALPKTFLARSLG